MTLKPAVDVSRVQSVEVAEFEGAELVVGTRKSTTFSRPALEAFDLGTIRSERGWIGIDMIVKGKLTGEWVRGKAGEG